MVCIKGCLIIIAATLEHIAINGSGIIFIGSPLIGLSK